MEAHNNSSKETTTLLGVFAYIGPLIIISYIFAKDNAFVKFHIKQGLLLFIVEIIIMVFGNIFYHLWGIINIINIIVFILAIIGIVNVLQHKEKELPFIGQLANKFKF